MTAIRNILYVSCLCSPSMLEYIFATASTKPGVSAQKFHRLLAEGLAAQPESCTVRTMSTIPVTHASHTRRFWWLKKERAGNLTYGYIPMINLPVIKNLMVFIGAFAKTVCWALRDGGAGKVVICDVLNLSVSAAAFCACRLTGIKTVAIVTDLPDLMITTADRSRLRRWVYNRLTSAFMLNYDGYVLLTEQMNNVVNVRSRPYLIMEGLVDSKMAVADNRLEDKAAEKTVMYAGGIYEKYGVKKLIEAFMLLKGDNLRLIICGPGEMAVDMGKYITQDPRVQYLGIIPNDEVVRRQIKANLLVNPRSSREELAMYSFPSKNMESMVSGTPLVTTPLPGMPEAYYPFVYIFDDESVDGFHRTLAGLLARPREELHDLGRKAREFVLAFKNNRVQAERVLSLLQSVQSNCSL